MKRCISLFLLVLVFLFSCGCGKKGPLQPPLVKTPQTVTDLSLFQKGDKLILSWANPTAYMDGNPLKEVAEVEIWAAEEDKTERGSTKKMSVEEFEGKANLLAKISRDQFSPLLQEKAPDNKKYTYVFPLETGQPGRKILTFAVKIKDEKRRTSAFSDLLSLEVRPSPLPPQNVRASVFEKYIEVRWTPPATTAGEPGSAQPVGYKVYRAEGEEPPILLNSSLVKGEDYRDGSFSFDKTYRYFVRAVASEAAPFRESDDSEAVEILAKDTFPPAPPAGLTVISGTGFIALSWEANKEPDLAGYKVWRSAAGQADFVLLKSLPATETTYSDSLVEKNKRYDYAITALDNSGNESRRSEMAPGLIRDHP
jgi:predicted small lipoprotein YifL